MTHEQPFFSIIIPTYARPRELAICLESLAHLEYPPDRFEVIVVDDGSASPPEEVVAAFRDRLAITLLAQPNAGCAAARNTGSTYAKGRFLAFTDDDCRPAPGWLQNLAAPLLAAPDHAIGGRTLNGVPDNPYSTTSHLLLDYLYHYYNAKQGQARFFGSGNVALPAERFRAIGGFDASFPLAAAEDREFCDRWLHHGYRMTFAPEARVYHAHALTLRTFWRQQFNYGRGAFRFHRARARRGSGRVKLEPGSFYLSLLRYPFAQKSQHPPLLIVALMLMSQVATTAGYFWESSRKSEHDPKYDKAEN